MPAQSCDGCGKPISIAGGIANVWSFHEGRATEGTGMTLEFEDGSTHRLCFPCIEGLPDHPSAENVDDLAARKSEDTLIGASGSDVDELATSDQDGGDAETGDRTADDPATRDADVDQTED